MSPTVTFSAAHWQQAISMAMGAMTWPSVCVSGKIPTRSPPVQDTGGVASIMYGWRGWAERLHHPRRLIGIKTAPNVQEANEDPVTSQPFANDQVTSTAMDSPAWRSASTAKLTRWSSSRIKCQRGRCSLWLWPGAVCNGHADQFWHQPSVRRRGFSRGRTAPARPWAQGDSTAMGSIIWPWACP